MINHKKSFYNFEFPYKNDSSKHVLYNSRTNALVLINSEEYISYENYVKNGTPISNKELEGSLEYGGFIVPKDVNEIDLIRYNLFRTRYNTSYLGLTIAPTLDCNFRCIYCYEKDSLSPIIMTTDIQEKVVEFVKSNVQTIKQLSVTWYGGEPLLAFNIIEYLSEQFISICNEYNVSYNAGIVTNGYLLNHEKVSKFEKLKISSVQVTLDGSETEHNKRRPLKGGLPTFETIISNLKNSKDFFPCKVSIRVNTDKSNVEQIDDILSIIKENNLDDIVSIYLAKVDNTNNSYNDANCFLAKEFASVDYNFKIKNKFNMINSFPRLVYNACGADSQTSFVINADGNIYKCWDDIGIPDRVIGSLVRPSVGNVKVLMDYMLYDPTEDECKRCKFLPICMGGCPHKRLFDRVNRCTYMKYRLPEYIESISCLLADKGEKQMN